MGVESHELAAMRIKSIRIDFEPTTNNDDVNHATYAILADGLWTFNGRIYPRVAALVHELWKYCKDAGAL